MVYKISMNIKDITILIIHYYLLSIQVPQIFPAKS